MHTIELMAPAGNYESLMAAIQGGCDSVYFGIEQLNMRARASMNFGLHDLPEIVSICNRHSIRSYITLNTLLYDHDLTLMKSIVQKAKQAGISAIIASDQAAIAYAHAQDVPVHISTQLNISNIETLRFYAHFADVVVLARELSLIQMKNIVQAVRKENICGPSGKLIRVEVFAHGALCMAVSGKCYLSLHTHNASANRGACIQNCRREYTVTDKEEGHQFVIDNEYIMSPKDLCTIDFLDQLAGTGIQVLKLEGRGRAPEYVKTVTRCYREAIDSLAAGTYTPDKVENWLERLRKVYNRGFWDGYYLGRKLGEWTDKAGSQATEKKVYLGKGMKYFGKIGVGEFLIESHLLKKGDKILITGPTSGVIEGMVEEIRVQKLPVLQAEKGQLCSFKINQKIRANDKLYKVVSA